MSFREEGCNLVVCPQVDCQGTFGFDTSRQRGVFHLKVKETVLVYSVSHPSEGDGRP